MLRIQNQYTEQFFLSISEEENVFSAFAVASKDISHLLKNV